MSALLNRIFSGWTELRREDGQATAEYALILGVVVLGAVTLLHVLGTDIRSILTNITNAI